MEQSKLAYHTTTNQAPPTVVVYTQPPPYHHTQQHPVPAPAPIPEVNSRWRNKPQSEAAAAGASIMFSAGMNLALGVGLSMHCIIGNVQHFCLCWFVGVIIGSLLSMPLQRVISRRIIMAISSGLILLGGVLFIAQSGNADAILAARYINGIAVGLSIVPYLVHASEVADDSYRGTCLATEQFCVSCGIAIQMIYSSYWSYNTGFEANIMHGILDVAFGIVGLCTFKSYIESPIYHIRQGDDRAALGALVMLQQPRIYTLQTQELLQQRKMYVQEEENLTVGENVVHSIIPLIKMILYRSMMLAFCCSLPVQMAFQYSMLYENIVWAPSVAACVRVLGSVFSLILIDRIGRKLPSLFAMAIIGSLMLALGYLCRSFYIMADFVEAKNVYMAIQFFAGFYSPYASVYVSEAFPMKSKPLCMSICVMVEQLLHIIIITTTEEYVGGNISAQGGIIVGAFALLFVTMPETRNTSLLEAQRRFRNLFYFNFK